MREPQPPLPVRLGFRLDSMAAVLRHLATPGRAAGALLGLAACGFHAAASTEAVRTSDLRCRYMPPLWLDRLRFQNVAATLPEAQTGECSLHGRVRLVAPAGLDETIAEQLVGTLNRVVAAAEDHAAALGFGEHIKGHTWNLVIRRNGTLDASTLDGTVFVSSALVGMLIHESKAWQAALAGIFSHEVAHNVARHVLESQIDYFRFRWTVMLRLPLQFLSAAWAARGLPPRDLVDRWHDQEVGALCRQREHEADELAVSILARAGYPPDSLARTLPLLEPAYHIQALAAGQQAAGGWTDRLWAALASWKEGGRREGEKGVTQSSSSRSSGAGDGGRQGAKGEWEGPSTHPDPEERMRRMQALAAGRQVQELYRTHSWWTRHRLSRQ